MANDIVIQGFFSSDITGVPYFTQGYATLISFFILLFGNDYATFFQAFQIAIFVLSVEFFRRVSLKVLSINNSYFFAILLFLQPASFFYPQSCMYETLLIFCFALFTYSIFGEEFRPFLFSFSAASMLVVHQRSLFVIIIGIVTAARYRERKFLGIFSSFMIFPTIFVVRNGLFYDSWRLASAGDTATNGIREILGGNLADVALNSIYFWSAYSGPAKRGTWYHNVNVWNVFGVPWTHEWLLYLSISMSVLTFILFLSFLWCARIKYKLLSLYLLFVVLSAMVLDGLVIGDSRHRLIFSPFILLAILWLLAERMKTLNRIN